MGLVCVINIKIYYFSWSRNIIIYQTISAKFICFTGKELIKYAADIFIRLHLDYGDIV